MKKQLIILALFCICLTMFSHASDNIKKMYEKGLKCLDNKEYSDALNYIQTAANANYPDAQGYLGFMYGTGEGVEKNDSVAKYWFQKAAEQGNAMAQYNLGVMHEHGYGVEMSKFEAGLWYRKAAEQGYSNAQTGLGYIYETYLSNNERARYWYQKAAEQGNAAAQNNLGKMYQNVYGVGRNDSLAEYWLRKAAEQGYSVAQASLGYLYSQEKKDSLAMYWYQKAADQGDAMAQNNLGVIYDNGYGVDENDSLALCLFQKAAEQGDVTAQNNLANMYADGRGVEKNDTLAVFWYQKTAEQGDDIACYKLGNIYARGRGLRKNDSLAVYWYERAAKRGIYSAMDSLIIIYEKGIGVPKDIEKAQYWRDEYEKDNFEPIEGYYPEEKRIALVIGNSDYEKQRLPNAEKDALALHKVLSNLDFVVVACMNKDKNDMENAILDFCAKAKKYDIALVYYAGHAVQEKGINYLIPVRPSKKIDNYDDLKNSCIGLPLVIDSLNGTGNRKNIIILDACRDRPSFVWQDRGGQGGLARISELENYLVAFSTLAGEKAKDGTGQNNSPYMTALLEELEKKGQSVDDIFTHVRTKVMDMTKMEQIPSYWNNLNETDNKFYFNK
ncbi:MAG: SEL1-like repeat protein [Prevotella sp.]|nr:SEL1-like repeat protein [Prevotella sp.]